MQPKKTDIVRTQKKSIGLVAALDLVVLLAWFLTNQHSAKIKLLISFFIFTLLLLSLLFGLKKANQLQQKMEEGQLDDPEVEKLVKTPVFDERQQKEVLKSYQIGFCFMISVLWLGTILSNTFPESLIRNLAMWGGLGVYVTYANLKGSSPYVDGRFRMAKYGNLFGWFALLFGIFTAVLAFVLFFLEHHFTGELLIVGLALAAMGGSILYRRYQDKKEDE